MGEPVVQLNELGCSAACVAFILGISYSEALELFPGGAEAAEIRGFLCKEIVEVLGRTGRSYHYKYLTPRWRSRIYKPGTIILLPRNKDYPYGHYIVRGEGVWMDPRVNYRTEKSIRMAQAGFRRKLPVRPIYALLPA